MKSEKTKVAIRRVYCIAVCGGRRRDQLKGQSGGPQRGIRPLVAKAAVPQMQKSDRTSECAGSSSSPARAAIRNFARGWIVDLAPRRIRVNVLVPGSTSTPGWHALAPTEEFHQKMVEMESAAAPLGRMGEPDEIASAALFLASDESSYVNGSELHADGGAGQI
jgi:NAD(P)-dependent dehydrogenase (short-subunit alcohol dehydrogenase family)